VEIIDLKYGKGVRVDAEKNSQLRLYGLGACCEYGFLYDFKTVAYTIYQPRLDNISTYTEDVETLLKWGEEIVKPAAKVALKTKQACIPGKYCDSHFCKARPVCREYNNAGFELNQFEYKHPSKLDNAEISAVLEYSERVKKWCSVVEAYALDKAIKGEHFPGYKLVEGVSKRKYTDDEKIKKALLDNGYEEKDFIKFQLVGITDMQKIIGKEDFESIVGPYIVKPQGKPTLVPETDKRPEMNSLASALKDFEINE
jgi:hypothetical protein